MGKKTIMIKKVQEPSFLQIKQHLSKIRDRIIVGKKSKAHQNLREFVMGLSSKYRYGPDSEDESRPKHIAKPHKLKLENMKNIPDPFVDFIETLIARKSIPMDEIEYIDVTIFPPPKKSSSYVNSFQSSNPDVRDRFFYFINSDERAQYKITEIDDIKKIAGSMMPDTNMSDVFEHAEREIAHYLPKTSSPIYTIEFNDEEEFTCLDSRNRTQIKRKLPLTRYGVLFDFTLQPETLKKNVVDTTKMIFNQSNENSNKGKLIKKIANEIKEKESDGSIGRDEIEEIEETMEEKLYKPKEKSKSKTYDMKFNDDDYIKSKAAAVEEDDDDDDDDDNQYKHLYKCDEDKYNKKMEEMKTKIKRKESKEDRKSKEEMLSNTGQFDSSL